MIVSWVMCDFELTCSNLGRLSISGSNWLHNKYPWWIVVLCLWAGTRVFIVVLELANMNLSFGPVLWNYQVCMPLISFLLVKLAYYVLVHKQVRKLTTHLVYLLMIRFNLLYDFVKLEWKERCAEKNKAAEVEIDRDVYDVVWFDLWGKEIKKKLRWLGLMAVCFLVSVHDDIGRFL